MASERPVLAEKAEEYALGLKEGGCDKVEDLQYFDRPFYASVGMRYADITQWLEVLEPLGRPCNTQFQDNLSISSHKVSIKFCSTNYSTFKAQNPSFRNLDPSLKQKSTITNLVLV